MDIERRECKCHMFKLDLQRICEINTGWYTHEEVSL